MTHPDLGDAEAQHLLQMQIDRALARPAGRDLSPDAKAADPRFIEVSSSTRGLPGTGGIERRSVARFSWRRDAHGGCVAQGADPMDALENLAKLTESTRAPWQGSERVEVLVRVEDFVDGDRRVSTTTGVGSTVGLAITLALEKLRGGDL